MIPASVFLSLALQCAPSIHPDTTTDIAKVESGFRHMAIAVVNGNSIYPKNLNDAKEHIKQLKSKGRNYSVGLMQINHTNFKKYNVSADDMLDPCKNLKVFEKILTDCYTRGKTLLRGLSCYYSGNFNTGQRAEKAFADTSYVQRIGYAVPSTRQERQGKASSSVSTPVLYPDAVIKGSISQPQNDHFKFPAQIVRGSFVITETKESKNENDSNTEK